jgi:hypothetical protein
MALLYISGGVTILLVLAFPHPPTLSVGVLLVLGSVAPVIGLVLYVIRYRLLEAALPWLLGCDERQQIGGGVVQLLLHLGCHVLPAVFHSTLRGGADRTCGHRLRCLPGLAPSDQCGPLQRCGADLSHRRHHHHGSPGAQPSGWRHVRFFSGPPSNA